MDWSGPDTTFSGNEGGNEEVKRQNLKRGHSESSRGARKYLRPDWCYAFNTEGGCSRSSGDTCKKGSRVLKHFCSHVDADGKMCAAKDHGEAGHEQ